MLCPKQNHQEYKYICHTKTCGNSLLCVQCLKTHKIQHPGMQIVSLNKASLLAEHNLQNIEKAIDQIQFPIRRKEQLSRKIDDQIYALQRQMRRLIQSITSMIENQIKILKDKNPFNYSEQSRELSIVKDAIREKKLKYTKIKQEMKKQPKKILEVLNMTIQKELLDIKKYKQLCKISTSYELYQNVTHAFQITSLKFKTESIGYKSQIKTMNESPLYFLIDSPYHPPKRVLTKNIYYFISKERMLKIFNVENNSWSNSIAQFDLPENGCPAYDKLNDIYFWIGGRRGRQAVNSIITFKPQTGKSGKWNKDGKKMGIGRIQCMASVVYVKKKVQNQKQQLQAFLVIVGGINELSDSRNSKVYKQCQIIGTKIKQSAQTAISLGQTNFGAFAGTLVTYNDTTILKIGGLNIKNIEDRVNKYSIVEVIQKIDCSDIGAMFDYTFEGIKLIQKPQFLPKWRYIEMEVNTMEDYELRPKLFYVNQAAVQISPNQIFVFGGGRRPQYGSIRGSYLIGIQQYQTISKQIDKIGKIVKQQRFCVRWPNQKQIISQDNFEGLTPIIYGGKVHTFQNNQKQQKYLTFDMYTWTQIQARNLK